MSAASFSKECQSSHVHDHAQSPYHSQGIHSSDESETNCARRVGSGPAPTPPLRRQMAKRSEVSPQQSPVPPAIRQVTTTIGDSRPKEGSTDKLFSLWMEYVRSTRAQEGLYGWLPRLGQGRCHCGRSRMSFPHWPPTSFEEAVGRETDIGGTWHIRG